MFIDTIFVSTRKKCVSKCIMRDLSHLVRYCNYSSGSGKALTLYCAAGPSPLVITGVTMESATIIVMHYGWVTKSQFLTCSLPEKYLVIILFDMIRFTQLQNLGLQEGQSTFKGCRLVAYQH